MLALVGCKQASSPAESTGAGTSTGQETAPPQGPACGQITCAAGEVCCNASCSICTPPNGMCTQQICEQEAPSATPGGQGGESVPPGEASPVAGAVNGASPADQGQTSCANVRCMAGTHCEMVQVQCVRAPCNPVPECKPDAPAPAGSGVTCGKNTCAPGQTCCNASCGICTDPGKGCIKMFCADGQMPR